MKTSFKESVGAAVSSASILLATCSASICAQGVPPIVWSAQGHSQEINAVAFSADGAILASASDDATVKLWRVKDRQAHRTLRGHTDDVQGVVFTPDGERVVSGGKDNTVRIWRASDGTLESTIQEQGSFGSWVIQPRHALALSPDGSVVAFSRSYFDQSTSRWLALVGIRRLSDGALVQVLTRQDVWIDALAYSPDGQWLAAAMDQRIGLWRLSNGNLERMLDGATGTVETVAFSPDGERLAAAGNDRLVRVWRTADGSLLASLTGHTDRVRSVAFSPNGNLLASAGFDRRLILWDAVMNTGPLRQVRGGENFRAVAFSPDSQLMATGDKGDAVMLFSAGNLEQLSRLTGHTEPPTALAFTPDGAYLTSAAGGVDDQSVRLWRTSDGQPTLYGTGHRSPVKRLRFTEDGQTLLSASPDLFIQWSVRPEFGGGMQIVQTLVGFGWGFPSLLEVAPDGGQVADGWDAILRLGSFVAPATLTQMPAQGVVSAIAFSPDSKSLAAGEASGVVRIWTTGTTNVATILTGHTDKVSALAYSPEGHWLASGSHDRTVRIWNLLNASSRTLLGHGSIIHAVYFAPDGSRVASVSSDKTIRFWNVADGQQAWAVTNDVNDVTAVALAPDWKTMAAWGDARTLRVWQVGESTVPQVFDQECVGIAALAFSPNSRWLAYSRQDASLFLAHNPTLTPTLKLEGARLTEAGFSVQVSVQPDWPVTLQVSGDLRTWQTLTNVVPDSTVLPVLDPEARQQPQRFYRAFR